MDVTNVPFGPNEIEAVDKFVFWRPVEIEETKYTM